jgi:hypothetical protein
MKLQNTVTANRLNTAVHTKKVTPRPGSSRWNAT